jgi:hypothetical protein
MGVASLVIGIVALISSFIPFCGIWALLPALVGLGLGIGEVVTKAKSGEPRGLGIAGLILNPLAIIVMVSWFWLAASMSEDAINQLPPQLRKQMTYPASGNTPAAPVQPTPAKPLFTPGNQPMVDMKPMQPVPDTHTGQAAKPPPATQPAPTR